MEKERFVFRIMTPTLLLIALVVLALFWAGSHSSTVAALTVGPDAGPITHSSVITIGLAADFSGPVQALGWQEANAVQLAISQTNAAGGVEIGGITYTLALVTVDDACDPTQAVAAAQFLLDAGAVVVVGHACSGASFAAQPLYYTAGVVMLTPSSTRVDLTEQGYDTTFRVCARDDAQARRLAAFLYADLGHSRVAIVEPAGVPPFYADAFADAFTGLGGTITSRRTVTSTADYTATLELVKPEDPDAIYHLNADGYAAGLLSRVADSLGMSTVTIAWDTQWENPGDLGNYVVAAGPAAWGDYAAWPQLPTGDMPGYAAFNEDYVAAGFPNWGDEAGLFGALAYDDAQLLIAALSRAGSADPAAIRDALAATAGYAGVVGNYRGFDALGDVVPQWATIYPLTGPWQPLGGPAFPRGQASALAVDPTISGTLFAAVQTPGMGWGAGATLYRSTDGGGHWTLLYDTAEGVRSLATNGSMVYAGVYNRDEGNPHPLIYRSGDDGQTWEGVFPMADGSIWTLAFHPTLVGTALAGGGDYPDKAMLLRTEDAGFTWAEVFSYTLPGGYHTVNAAAVLPLSPTVWLLSHDGAVDGDWGAYICRSTDQGASWLSVYTISQDLVDRLVIDPITPTTVYASTGMNNLLRSEDGGASWVTVVGDGSAGQQLVVDGSQTLYAVRGNEARVSSDGGSTWTTVGDLPGNVLALDVDRGLTPGVLYAGLVEQGLYRSADGGANWEERNDGISTLAVPRDIDVDPQDPQRLFVAAEGSSGWRSDDGGQTWQSLSLPHMGAFAITPQDPAIVLGGAYNCWGASLYRSADGGVNFTPVFTASFIITDCSGGDEALLSVEVAPALSTTVYAAGWDHPDWGPDQAVVLRSLDGGLNWTVAFTRPAESYFEVVAIDPTDPDRVYAGGRACDGGPCQGVLYRTTDGGANWTLVLTNTDKVRSVAVDPQKPSLIYVGSDDYSLHKSKDGGDSWATIRTCCPSGNLLAVDPYVPSHIYLGGWGYLAESRDGGHAFTDGNDPFNVGVPPMEPRALTVLSDGLEETFYAGFNGVWTYQRSAPQPGEAAVIQMWTDPFSGAVYANGLNPAFYHGLVVDWHDNWVADGTPVTVTYDLREIGEGSFQTVKHTQDGHVQDGLLGVSTAGTVTFTSVVNVRATAWVTVTFLYNPPAGITITAAPASLPVGGATGLISATVPGLHDGVASNGTLVSWATTLGDVITATWTSAGLVTTMLTSGDVAGSAVVTATAAAFEDTMTVEFVGGEFRIYLPLVQR